MELEPDYVVLLRHDVEIQINKRRKIVQDCLYQLRVCQQANDLGKQAVVADRLERVLEQLQRELMEIQNAG